MVPTIITHYLLLWKKEKVFPLSFPGWCRGGGCVCIDGVGSWHNGFDLIIF